MLLVANLAALTRRSVVTERAERCLALQDFKPVLQSVDILESPETVRKSSSWYAVRVRSNCEKSVSQVLHEKGFDEFLPTYKKLSRWSDRYKIIQAPLFPGYVLCDSDLTCRSQVMSTPGVVGIVRFGSDFAPVPELEVVALQMLCRQGSGVLPWPYLEQGDKVRIEHGPLKDFEGILIAFKGSLRIAVSINILGRSVSAEIDRQWIRPLVATRTAAT